MCNVTSVKSQILPALPFKAAGVSAGRGWGFSLVSGHDALMPNLQRFYPASHTIMARNEQRLNMCHLIGVLWMVSISCPHGAVERIAGSMET
jgi:hypothetical protein